MKKQYIQPNVTLVMINNNDLIATSNTLGYGGPDSGNGIGSAPDRSFFDEEEW